MEPLDEDGLVPVSGAVAAWVSLGGDQCGTPEPESEDLLVALAAGLPGTGVAAVNPDYGIDDDPWGVGWSTLVSRGEPRAARVSHRKDVQWQAWRRQQTPLLLDLGAGPSGRCGGHLVQLPSVTRVRFERGSGAGTAHYGDYSRWDFERDLRGMNVVGFVGQVPRDLGARRALSRCLSLCRRRRGNLSWALTRQFVGGAEGPFRR